MINDVQYFSIGSEAEKTLKAIGDEVRAIDALPISDDEKRRMRRMLRNGLYRGSLEDRQNRARAWRLLQTFGV